MKTAYRLLLAGMVLTVGGLFGARHHDVAQAATASFSVDAVPGGAVDASRSVSIGASFSVDIVLDSYGDPWASYQVTADYDDVELDAGGLPANWESAPVADVTGGNLATFPNGPLCDPNPGSNAVASEDDSGSGTMTVTCADSATDGTTIYTGPLVEFVLTCEKAGTADITIHDVSDTFVLEPTTFTPHNDQTHKATITCGGTPVPATPTSTAATATGVPATPAPTSAATGTAGGATATPRTGGPAGAISGPNTGAGPGGSRGERGMWLVLGLLAASGAAIAAASCWRRSWR